MDVATALIYVFTLSFVVAMIVFVTKVFYSDFIGFGPLKNKAAQLASHDWILSLDSDEVLSKELIKEINTSSLDKKSIYSIPRINFFNGKKIKCCGWYPEAYVRLYHKKTTKFDNVQVHEAVITKEKKVIKFTHPIYHYSYLSIDDFLKK